MPAIMDDPESATIYRVSGAAPFPDPKRPCLPESIVPRQVMLRDRQTVATIVPFASQDQVPPSLLLYLSDQFRKEVEGGDTYPMIEPLPLEKFSAYWFQNFAAVMLLGSVDSPGEVVEGKDWSRECLGSFYIKPNYPGRSSHVCNAGFLVTEAARNRGVGRLMGESYLNWAPKLAYTYSVFNLVYETNVASCKIWDALGFKRIGRVKGCGNLKSYPDRLIDAIIYGRDLVLGESEELVSEERFTKIKFYLKYGKYPHGADRAEKSRLRSAATHYKLLENDTLMLKDKEVVSDPERQYRIAREVHLSQHGGINKTTATIAERYHWSRIKETVYDVIRNCTECKEQLGKTPAPATSASKARPGLAASAASSSSTPPTTAATTSSLVDTGTSGRRVPLRNAQPDHQSLDPFTVAANDYVQDTDPMTVMSPGQTLHTPTDSPIAQHSTLPGHNPMLQDQPHSMHAGHHAPHHHQAAAPLPLDHQHSVYQPIDPQIISHPFPPFHHHADADTFQALLQAADDDVGTHEHHHHHHHDHHDHDTHRTNPDDDHDVDLDMLIEQEDDEDDDGNAVDDDGLTGKMDIGRLTMPTGASQGSDGRGGVDKESGYDVEFGAPD